MRTTLNLPDALVSRAKTIARSENTTLTALIIEGLDMRIRNSGSPAPLPVSRATGGLQNGVTWGELESIDSEGDRYR